MGYCRQPTFRLWVDTADSVRQKSAAQCPLLGVKQTFLQLTSMSAFDPKRTSGAQNCCCANLPWIPFHQQPIPAV